MEELTALQNIQAGALGRHGWLWAIRNLLGWLDPGSCISSVQRVGLDQELLHQSVQQLSGGTPAGGVGSTAASETGADVGR